MTTDASSGQRPGLCPIHWLADHLDDPKVRIVDGSFHIPGSGRDARAEFAQGHPPGAVFFDINAVCDPLDPLPHMLPSPEGFAQAVGELGIGNRHRVVVYDQPGSQAAPRVWWMLRVFGHDDVLILDGGLPKWRAEGRPLTNAPAPVVPAPFTPRFRPHLVADRARVIANLDSRHAQIADARGPRRFSGEDPEPRPTRHRGHIPGSVNLPFNGLTDPEHHGCWRDNDALAARFASAGLDLARPLIATCGSGVTACSIAFAAYLLGRDDVAVYDGSWAEWGNRDDVPVALGRR